LLYLRSGYAELLTLNGQGFQSLTYIPLSHTDGRDTEQVLPALSKVLNCHFAVQSEGTDSSRRETLTLWDGIGLDADLVKKLEQKLYPPLEIHQGREDWNRIHWDGKNTPECDGYAVPVHLAHAGFQSARLPIDFLHSRLREEKKKTGIKPVLGIVMTCLALILGSLYWVWDWHQDNQEITAMSAALAGMQKEADAARSLLENINMARGWYSQRPKILDCLYKLTLCFPEQPTIWGTSLALREDMRGIITGKSLDEAGVLGVLDNLKASPVFTNVQILYIRETGRNSQDVVFAIDFIYSNGK
jgi:hypothetical protein